jgi:hypothetical protein
MWFTHHDAKADGTFSDQKLPFGGNCFSGGYVY